MDYYYTFKNYLENLHGTRAWRIPLSTGFPCPNRINGKKGCTFCNGESFLPSYLKNNDTLNEQIQSGIQLFSQRYKVNCFYGYFQFNTSTYGPLDDLLQMYETVLSKDEMKGLVISTRPDHISKEIIRSITNMNKKYNKDVWIELGLQSTNDATLERIDRGHSYNDFKTAVKIIKENSSFKITVHMVLGLPGESPVQTINGVTKLFRENGIDGIKFRLLEILHDTPIETDRKENPDDFFKYDTDSFVELICDLLEVTPENVVIMRLANHSSLQKLNSETKIISKNEIVDKIIDKFKDRGTKQGSKFENDQTRV